MANPDYHTPSVGDKVRVTYEGTVTSKFAGDSRLYVQTARDSHSVYRHSPSYSVEVIKPAEPEYKAGEVYRSTLGSTYIRTKQGTWRGLYSDREVADEIPARPLTRFKLVEAD